MLGLDGGERLAAVGRLEQPVALMTQQRDQELPVGREIVNDQDRRHTNVRLYAAKIRPVSSRMSRISSTSPIPPLGP